MKQKILWKFFGAAIVLMSLAMFVLNFFVTTRLQGYYEAKITQSLERQAYLVAEIIAPAIARADQAALEGQTQAIAERFDLRVTVVDLQGVVIADSQQDVATMANHRDRPEIIEAFSQGAGDSTRFSDTLGFTMKYVAVPITSDGATIGAVRLALDLAEVTYQLKIISRVVLVGTLLALLITFGIGYILSRTITSPLQEMTRSAQRLAQGDFSSKVPVRSGDEFGDLARSFNSMATSLESRITELKKMDTVRADFVANITHELKTPLTAIKGFIETLEDSPLDDAARARKFIGIIKKHTERLQDIINDLLKLSELEGNVLPVKEPFDLRGMIDEVASGFTYQLGVKKHILTVDYPPGALMVMADKNIIEQVLVNLFDNAINYTPDGGRITVRVSDEAPYYKIAISDTGIGIPPEEIDRICERFYRIDKARSRHAGGTGLGLAIVKHGLMLHGTSLHIASTLGHGTTMTITLRQAVV